MTQKRFIYLYLILLLLPQPFESHSVPFPRDLVHYHRVLRHPNLHRLARVRMFVVRLEPIVEAVRAEEEPEQLLRVVEQLVAYGTRKRVRHLDVNRKLRHVAEHEIAHKSNNVLDNVRKSLDDPDAADVLGGVGDELRGGGGDEPLWNEGN